MVGHQLVSQKVARVTRQPLGKNLFESIKVVWLTKNRCAAVAPIEGMIDAAAMVCSLRSSHVAMIRISRRLEKSPDTFKF